MSNPCATCTRRCCHHYLVTVTGYDAWVIAKGLRLAPEQFLITVPQQTPNGRGFRLDASDRTFEIALDKASARTKEKPCVFWLGLPGGGGRCGIYPFRPFVCQTYPAFLTHDGVQRREDVLCPESAWRDETLLRPEWRQRLCRMHVEFDVYATAVERWNGHVGLPGSAASVISYYSYLMHFYERLEPVRRGLGDAEWSAMAERWSAALFAGERPLATPIPTLSRWQEGVEAIVTVASSIFGRNGAPLEIAEEESKHALLVSVLGSS
jgi:Fe-S-cluster containining protein